MPEHLLRTIHTRMPITGLALTTLAWLGGCQAAAPTTAPSSAQSPAPSVATDAATIDPISREPVTGDGFVGYYGMWKVHFENAENAAQFASLAPAKRAKLAAPQVLKAKGIANTTCPLTGEPLTAAAAPVRYEGQVLGFASVADANQFNSLTKQKQAQIVAKWRDS